MQGGSNAGGMLGVALVPEICSGQHGASTGGTLGAVLFLVGCVAPGSTNASMMLKAALVLAGCLGLSGASTKAHSQQYSSVGSECMHTHACTGDPFTWPGG